MKEFWDERFSDKKFFYGTLPNQFLTSVCGLIPKSSKILCIGEGEGRNAVFLATLGFKVTAVDFSIEGMKKAMVLANENKVDLDYKVASLEDFDFGTYQWDAVVSIFCHLPPAIRENVHHQVKHGLKNNGLFILESYNPDQLEYKSGGPKDQALLYTAQMLQNDFKNLDWLLLENSLCDISEGSGHQGMSSILNGVGRLKA